jgi:hypothetical protein
MVAKFTREPALKCVRERDKHEVPTRAHHHLSRMVAKFTREPVLKYVRVRDKHEVPTYASYLSSSFADGG